MTLKVERYTLSDESAVTAFLSQAPYDNVFLTHLVLSDPIALARGSMYVAYDEGRLRGVVYFGRQVVLAADDASIDAFVSLAVQHRGERMIVAPRPQVARYWAAVKRRHEPPRMLRDRQPVMAVDAATLAAGDDRTVARLARPSDAPEVARNSAAMIAGELGYDPRTLPGDFAGGVAQMIERRMWWVGERDAKICFVCNVGAWSPHTAQLQSIWTPEKLRGKGLATSALIGVCRNLLEEVPSLCLYVNDFNDVAIKLYERAGFRVVGEFQSILF